LSDYLNEKLPYRWIGEDLRELNLTRPPSYLALMPMDFNIWSFIEREVYITNYQNLFDLKALNTRAFRKVNRNGIFDPDKLGETAKIYHIDS